MSGGSFDYAYSKFRMFADDLRDKLNHQGQVKDARWGDMEMEWPADLAAKLYAFADEVDQIADIARAIEWVYSCDSSEDAVREAFEKRGA
jgi:hypothetical protein